jgi:uncharacterized metal-binding protein
MGIEKNRDFNLKREDIQKLKATVKEKLQQNRHDDFPMIRNNRDGCCC